MDFLFVGRHSIYTLDYTVVNAANIPTTADALPVASFRRWDDDTEQFQRSFTPTTSTGVYRLELSSLETSTPGLYYVWITYTLGGIAQAYRVDIEIPTSMSNVYESLSAGARTAVDSVWMRFADLFDSDVGGPNLQMWAQSNFGKERLAQLLSVALGRMNTVVQPHQNFSIAADDFPYASFGGLLELSLYVETIKHLIRSYIEQPTPQGMTVVRLDRSAYYQRWIEMLHLEEEDLRRGLEIFKMSYLGLGRAAVLVGGGVFGEWERPMPLARPRYRQISGWIR